MGAPYDAFMTQWSKGEYKGATNFEDDLAIIRSTLAYPPDEPSRARLCGGRATTAPAANGSCTLAGGAAVGVHPAWIRRPGDQDTFSFVADAAGTARFEASVLPGFGQSNLRLGLDVLSSSGAVLQTAAMDPLDADSIVAAVQLAVTAGTPYTVRARPLRQPQAKFSAYGSLGAYTIKSSLPVSSGAPATSPSPSPSPSPPAFCTSRTVTAAGGTVEDGSGGTQDYGNR